MRPGRFVASLGLCFLLALPALAQPAQSPQGPATAPTPPDKATGKSEKAGELIDINSASAEELDRLPGVGPARAQAIISHRPYHGKDDLTNRKIIPESVYSEIKDKIIARQGPTK